MAQQKRHSTWTIGKKLYALVGLLLVSMIAIGGNAYYHSKQLVAQIEELTEVELPAVRTMTLIDMMHGGLRAVAFNAIIKSGSKDGKETKSIRDEYEQFSKNMKEYLATLDKLPLKPALKIDLEKARPGVETYIKDAGEIVGLGLEGKTEKAMAALPKFEESFEKLEKSLDVLGEEVSAEVKASHEQGNTLAKANTFSSALAISCGLLLGIILSLRLVQGLLGQLIKIVDSVRDESKQVKLTSANISAVSQNLYQSSSQQEAALQETAASIEEMNAMVKKSSENADRSRNVAQSSLDVANQGKSGVDAMVNAINEIDQSNNQILEQVEASNQKFSEIVRVITEIGNKTKVINDIVFQTKLLSFNASVEAARAGEHGKGFAVVAEEVGNLAQMSGNAAKEISDMLNSSIKKVENIVDETKSTVNSLVAESREKIKNGGIVATQCGETLEKVVRNVSEVKVMIDEISSASSEQSLGISEITKAMSQIDQVTHENAATSQQTAASSEALSSQSISLLTVVEQLETLIRGDRGYAQGQDHEQEYEVRSEQESLSHDDSRRAA